MTVKEAGAVRPSARERLLAAADELFYKEGVHTVGIDRIIEQAGVAKASLYNTFGSKDELVRAYLQTRHAGVTQRIMRAVERYDTPRERLLAVFEGQGELFAQPDYRGCAFARASAESHPGDPAEQAAEAYRRWVRALLTELAAQVGVPEPEILARQLHLLYDGSGQSARMDHDAAAAAAARAAAATLLDAAVAGDVSHGFGHSGQLAAVVIARPGCGHNPRISGSSCRRLLPQPDCNHRRPGLINVVGQHYQVPELPVPVTDVVAQQRLAGETQAR